MTLFVLASKDGWVTIMYSERYRLTVGSTGPGAESDITVCVPGAESDITVCC